MSDEYIRAKLLSVISALAKVPDTSEMDRRASIIMHVIRELVHILYVVYNDYPTTDSKLDSIEDIQKEVDEKLTRIYNMR